MITKGDNNSSSSSSSSNSCIKVKEGEAVAGAGHHRGAASWRRLLLTLVVPATLGLTLYLVCTPGDGPTGNNDTCEELKVIDQRLKVLGRGGWPEYRQQCLTRKERLLEATQPVATVVVRARAAVIGRLHIAVRRLLHVAAFVTRGTSRAVTCLGAEVKNVTVTCINSVCCVMRYGVNTITDAMIRVGSVMTRLLVQVFDSVKRIKKIAFGYIINVCNEALEFTLELSLRMVSLVNSTRSSATVIIIPFTRNVEHFVTRIFGGQFTEIKQIIDGHNKVTKTNESMKASSVAADLKGSVEPVNNVPHDAAGDPRLVVVLTKQQLKDLMVTLAKVMGKDVNDDRVKDTVHSFIARLSFTTQRDTTTQ